MKLELIEGLIRGPPPSKKKLLFFFKKKRKKKEPNSKMEEHSNISTHHETITGQLYVFLLLFEPKRLGRKCISLFENWLV
jgi:hypothetical protein